VAPAELEAFPFPEANARIIAALWQWLGLRFEAEQSAASLALSAIPALAIPPPDGGINHQADAGRVIDAAR
jgi:hypothetical protein